MPGLLQRALTGRRERERTRALRSRRSRRCSRPGRPSARRSPPGPRTAPCNCHLIEPFGGDRGNRVHRPDVDRAVSADRWSTVTANGRDDPPQSAGGAQPVHVAGRARDHDPAVGPDGRGIEARTGHLPGSATSRHPGRRGATGRRPHRSRSFKTSDVSHADQNCGETCHLRVSFRQGKCPLV